jgi:outer membrane protein TolC
MLPQAQVQRIKSADEDVMARVRELDKKLQALEAARGTPVTEPPKAVEPPSQPVEPVVNHSLVQSVSQMLRGE